MWHYLDRQLGNGPKERLKKLNDIAIYQMEILTEDKRIEDMNIITKQELNTDG